MASEDESRRSLRRCLASWTRIISRNLCPGSPLGVVLEERLEARSCEAFTTIVTIQEVCQGWLAQINRRAAGREQISAYRQFHRAVSAFEHLAILDFDQEAAEVF